MQSCPVVRFSQALCLCVLHPVYCSWHGQCWLASGSEAGWGASTCRRGTLAAALPMRTPPLALTSSLRCLSYSDTMRSLQVLNESQGREHRLTRPLRHDAVL